MALNSRAPAQAFVEYALLAAVLVIAFLVGLSAISGAAATYLAHTEPTPPAAVLGALPNHLVNMTLGCGAPLPPGQVFTGHQFNCSVTVTDLTSPGPAQMPAGTIAFASPHGSIATCTLTGSGITSGCTSQYTPNDQGLQDLTATYLPSSAHVSTAKQLLSFTDAVDQTSLVLRCPFAPVPVGEPGQCTATVIDLYSGRSGMVVPGLLVNISAGTGTFSADGALSPQTPNSSSCTTTAIGCTLLFRSNPVPGEIGASHMLTATFAGDQAYDAATGNTIFPVGGAPSHSVTVVAGCTSGTQPSSPLQVNLNGSTTCTATVTDSAPNPNEITPTGPISWSVTPDYGGGSFSPASCNLVKIDDLSARCQVTYTPTSLGDPPGQPPVAHHQIVATYTPPDFIHTLGSDTSAPTTIYVTDQHPISVQVTCVPPLPTPSQPLLLGGPTAPSIGCTAWVLDTATQGTPVTPTGQITWTPTYGGSGGSGSFTGLPCNLQTVDSKTANCPITYFPTAMGNPVPPGPVNVHTLTAIYSGDGLHPAVSPSDTGSTTLYVANQHAVTVSQPSCVPQTNPLHVVGPPVTTASCTVTVTDPGPSPVTPSGTITWNMSPGPNGGAGSFSPSATCTLQGGGSTVQCAAPVTYTPTAVGTTDPNTHNIIATYSGDGFHPTAQGAPASVAVTN